MMELLKEVKKKKCFAMYMHEERINRSNMDWCSKLATNQCRTTFKNQATMFVGIKGPNMVIGPWAMSEDIK